MPRSDDARTEGALAEVTTLVPGAKGQTIQRLLTEWAQGKGKGATGKTIKLGGSFHSKDEKETRTQVRAVLLGAQFFGQLDPGGAGYKKFAQTIAKESTQALAKRLTDYYDVYRRFEVISSSPSGVDYAPSFRYAPDAVRWNCEKAYLQVVKIVHAGYQDVGMAIGGIAGSVQRYEAWFGSMADGRPDKVRSNFFAMLEALKTQKLVLYYRGPLPSGALAVRDDYNPFGPAMAPNGEEYCGMATRRSQRNLACPSGDDLHVKLGNGVVLRGSQEVAEGKNTYAGTIVHEVSHIVCETRDVKLKQGGTGQLIAKSGQLTRFTSGKSVPIQDNDGMFIQTYGPKFCQYMAQHWPDKAIMNADNYCCFVEQFL